MENSECLVLNSSGLTLHDAHFLSHAVGKSWQKVSSTDVDPVQERVTFHLGKQIPAKSQAKLKITFSSLLKVSPFSYFRSSWENGGEIKFYATTYFEVSL